MLYFSAGSIRANGAIAALGTGGTLCLYSHSPTDVVVDIVGWFTAGGTPATSAFVSPVPARWVDTREGLGAPARPVSPANRSGAQASEDEDRREDKGSASKEAKALHQGAHAR